MHPNFSIITGGQTGVDTAALLVAQSLNIPYSGYVPHGFTNELGRIPDSQIFSPQGNLTETTSTDNAERTKLNTNDADGILTISRVSEADLETVSPGTAVGLVNGRELGKSLLFVQLAVGPVDENTTATSTTTTTAGETEIPTKTPYESQVAEVTAWLEENNIERCAIGGARESEEKGIEKDVGEFLGVVFGRIVKAGWKSIRLSERAERGVREERVPVLRDGKFTS